MHDTTSKRNDRRIRPQELGRPTWSVPTDTVLGNTETYRSRTNDKRTRFPNDNAFPLPSRPAIFQLAVPVVAADVRRRKIAR